VHSQACGPLPPAVLYVRANARDGPVIGYSAGGGGSIRVALMPPNSSAAHDAHGGGVSHGGGVERADGRGARAAAAHRSLFVYSLCADDSLRVTLVAVSELMPPPLPHHLGADAHAAPARAATPPGADTTWWNPPGAKVPPFPQRPPPRPEAAASRQKAARRRCVGSACAGDSWEGAWAAAPLSLLFAASFAVTLAVGGVVAMLAVSSCWARRHYRQLAGASQYPTTGPVEQVHRRANRDRQV